MRIRSARATDAAAIAAIYAPHVDEGFASFEERALDATETARRIADISARYPWLVAEDAEGVMGFAYGSEHRVRAAYRWSVDVTVYVDPRAHRRGVGRALYARLFDLLRAQGFVNAYAGIALPNDPSVALHEAFGFTPIGVYRNIGFKSGAWRDVGWWGLQLQSPPPDPALPQPPAVG